MNEKIILAGGCFWGVEDILRKIPGVINTEVGYTGGSMSDPNYNHVKTGTTGHAEAVLVEYDSKILSLINLLDYFFRLHDPTTIDRQGNDLGSQYRSAIFYYNQQQKEDALIAKGLAQNSGRWKQRIVTEVIAAVEFYPAENYHQDYLVKNPNGYTCHWLRK